MKPIIGITTDFEPKLEDPRSSGTLSLNWNYAARIIGAGGVPILLAPESDVHTIAFLLDGLMIPGGRDIDASAWGETNHPSVKPVQMQRFEFEKQLWQALNPEMPVLGICYGCQFINVMRGGSLHQHLPDIVGHEHDQGGTLQDYSLDAKSRLSTIIGTQPKGKSYHHQAINGLGKGLNVVGHNADGTVEAIEDDDQRWIFGVQWHPERTPGDPESETLFTAFVNAARQYQSSKSLVRS